MNLNKKARLLEVLTRGNRNTRGGSLMHLTFRSCRCLGPAGVYVLTPLPPSLHTHTRFLFPQQHIIDIRGIYQKWNDTCKTNKTLLALFQTARESHYL